MARGGDFAGASYIYMDTPHTRLYHRLRHTRIPKPAPPPPPLPIGLPSGPRSCIERWGLRAGVGRRATPPPLLMATPRLSAALGRKPDGAKADAVVRHAGSVLGVSTQYPGRRCNDRGDAFAHTCQECAASEHCHVLCDGGRTDFS